MNARADRDPNARHYGVADVMLTSTGRLARMPFAAGAAVLFVLAWVYEWRVPAGVHRWTAFIFWCAILFSTACILSQRLHDRNRRGWWAFVPVFALVGVWPQPQGISGMICLVVLAFFGAELFFQPSRKGFNRFGPPPSS
jgi:uncharacterized membrane protein YhaH (DUF805 family)